MNWVTLRNHLRTSEPLYLNFCKVPLFLDECVESCSLWEMWFAEQMCCGHRVHTNTPLAGCELTPLLTLIGRNTPLALGYQHGEWEIERERERERARERENCESMAHLRNSVSTENEISSAIPRRCSAGVCECEHADSRLSCIRVCSQRGVFGFFDWHRERV